MTRVQASPAPGLEGDVPGAQPPDPDLDRELAVLRRARRQALARSLSFVTVVASVLLGLVRHGEAVDAWMRGETDWRGRVVYEPPFPLDRAALGRVDLERVHRRLLTRWARAVGRATTPPGRWRARWAFEDLRSAVAPDRNLEALVRELDEHLRTDPVGRAVRMDYLLWAWNDYLEAAGEAFRVEASLVVRQERVRLVPRTYRVLSDATNEHGARVRVLRRLDRSGPVEPWLGRTAREADGAAIPVDRVLHFAIHEVWPLLDGRLDHLAPARVRGLLPGVRAEAEAELDAASWRVLSETAEDVRALLDATRSIEARHGCGATFRVFELPYRGLSPRSVAMIELALEASRDAACPDLTLDEATQIVSASERLGRTGGIEGAIEALTMLVARSVASHELRHVEDGPARTLACPGCDPETPALVRAELSAYLAAFADERTGYLAALQACGRPETELGLQTVAAETAIGAVIPGGCEGAAPSDFHARARAAERRLFGERAVASVPSAFPATLALFSTRSAGTSLPTARR